MNVEYQIARGDLNIYLQYIHPPAAATEILSRGARRYPAGVLLFSTIGQFRKARYSGHVADIAIRRKWLRMGVYLCHIFFVFFLKPP